MNIETAFAIPLGISYYDKPLSDEQIEFINNLEYRYGQSHAFSFDTYILNSPILSDLEKWINSQIIKFYYETLRCPSRPYITQSWVNKIQKGMYTHKHFHSNSIVSGVFYVEAQDEIAFDIFRSDLKPKVLENNIFNNDVYSLPVNKNMLVLFPSYLSHSSPLSVEDFRYSIAFNTFVDDDLGTIGSLTYLEMNNG